MVEGVFFTTIKSLEKRIRSRTTGPPEELAEKLNISVTLLFYYLQTMREMNAPLAYNKKENTFLFETPGHLNEHFLWEPGNKQSVSSIEEKDHSQKK